MTTTDSTIRLKVDDKTGKGLKSAQGHLQNFTSAVGAVQGPLDGITGRMSAFNSVMGRAGLTIAATGVVIAGFTKALYESFQAGTEVEKNQLKLESLVKVTGGAAGYSAEQINAMAESLDRTTLASANGAREAAGALLSFKRVTGPVFERTLIAAQDMSAVFGSDLRSSAVQLGKALEDPAVGLTALNRVGITFTNTEKEMIKAMQDAGNIAGAQEVVLSKLEGQIGGSGSAQAGGTAGAIDTMAFAWTQLMEKMGESTAGQAAVDVLNGITNAITSMKEALTDEVTKPLDTQLLNQIELSRELNKEKKEEMESIFGLSAAENDAFDRKFEQIDMQIAIINAQKEVEEEHNQTLRDKAQAVQDLMDKEAEREGVNKAGLDRILETNRMLNDAAQAKIDAEETAFANKVARAKEENRLANIVAQEAIDNDKARIKSAKDRLKLEQSVATNIASIGSDLSGILKDQSRTAFKVHQGFAIAESTINSYQAFTNTLATVPIPFKFAAAGAVLAAGMAKVHAIASMSPGSGAGASTATPSAPSFSTPQVNDQVIPQFTEKEAPQVNIIKVYLGDRELAEVIVEGNQIAQDNDMQVFQTESGFERVIIA